MVSCTSRLLPVLLGKWGAANLIVEDIHLTHALIDEYCRTCRHPELPALNILCDKNSGFFGV